MRELKQLFCADLRARATDVLHNVIRYCLDVVSDPKGQTDLVSGLKEKEWSEIFLIFKKVQVYKMKYIYSC